MNKNELAKKINTIRNGAMMISLVTMILLAFHRISSSIAIIVMIIVTIILLYASYLASIFKKMK